MNSFNYRLVQINTADAGFVSLTMINGWKIKHWQWLKHRGFFFLICEKQERSGKSCCCLDLCFLYASWVLCCIAAWMENVAETTRRKLHNEMWGTSAWLRFSLAHNLCWEDGRMFGLIPQDGSSLNQRCKPPDVAESNIIYILWTTSWYSLISHNVSYSILIE